MKNVLTNLFNSSLFRHAQRLAIVCVLLSIAATATASGEWKGTAYAYAKFAKSDNVAMGEGKVYVGTSSTPSYGELNSEDETSAQSGNNTNDPKELSFYWSAATENGTNSAFAGWYTDVNASTLHTNEATFNDVIKVNKEPDKTGKKSYYALFRKVIDAPAEVSWTKTTMTANTTFDVNLYEATNFKVKSCAHKDGLSRDFSAKAESITIDKATITLSAGEDVVDGDVFNVVLTTDNGGDVTVPVKIVSKITVRFELPKRGQGYYEAKQPNNGNSVTYNSKDVGESRDINLTDTKQFFQKITAYPADGYQLYRWIVKDKNGNTSYPTSSTLEKTLNEGDVISVEFLPTGLAQFMVKDDPDKKLFYELDGDNGAFKHAEKLGKKVVVVHTSGTLYTEYKSITNGKYEFTIPAGYTLLVPADDAYTVATKLSDDLLVEMTTSLPKNHKKLTLSPNTRIQSNGHICVMAFTSWVQGYNGKPKTFGQIAMGDNTEIELNNGAQLTAFGYVTGDPTKSSVLAKSGSTVYEIFQFTDWRGGGQMMGTSGDKLIGNDKRVFPMAQFYVQSVETKLTIQHGATEYVSAGVEVDLKVYQMKIPLNMKLISVDNNSEDDEGFVCLGDGAEVSKWYDGELDRQVYHINKTEGKTSATAKFGKMYADISVAGKLDSRDYVLVVPNNMDVVVNDVTLTNANDIALLAGATLEIGKKAILNQQANLFVYDEEHNTGYFAAGGSELIPITYTAYHYERYLSDKTTYSYLSGGKPYAKKDTYIRTSTNLEDAKVIVDGQLIVTTKNSGLKDGSGFYTTAKGGSGKSSEDADYGAIITSNGGGVVDFQHIGTKTKTYQYKGNTTIVEIPITNARLRNGDGTWSAGWSAEDPLAVTETYTYSQTKEKWLTPQEMAFGTPENNVWDIRMPDPNEVTKTVGISLITDEELTIDNFDIVWPNNSYFAQAEDEVASYDPINKKLLLPITYTLTGVHNKDIVPNTYVGSIVVKCKDLNVTGDVVDEATIPLTAVEDYTPEFTIKINEVPVTTGFMYDFGQTDAQTPVSATLSIIPTEGTVATLGNTQWTIVPTGSFNATQTSVTYNPQTQTTGEYDEGTLTIIATYSDAATPPNQPACTVTVNLQGKAKLQESTLEFKDDLATEIYQAEELTDVFKDLGSREDITFTYEYADGNDAFGLFEHRKESSGNYTLIAKTTDYVDNRVVTVIATQGASEVMAGAERKVTITIKPVVTWNWSTLYFNTERENPVTVARAGDWTLTEVEGSDPNNLVALFGESPNYSATVGAGDASQVYTAKFKFVQGSYENEFTSSIYSDPRVLGFCVDYVRQFNDVSTPTVTTVTFDENTHKATFRPGNTWEINMTGMPDKLTFTATGNNLWYIGERASSSTNYTDVVAWSKLSGTQTIQLKPTTNQVIIQYGAGDNNGTITNLCISELEISADKDAVYFPINKDGSETTKKLILTHTEPTSPEISLDSHFTTTLSAVSNNLGTTPEEPYYQTTVTISGDMSAVEKGSYVLTATQGTAKITIPVHADEFPQGLPIKLATDDAKRYHFVAVEEDKVTWDETNKKVVFQTPEGEQTIRSVTFAFEGAPSRIKFIASQDIIDNQWRVDESADGSYFVTSGLANRDTEEGTKFVHNLQYTTRYVRLVYNSENKSEVELSDFVIEGDPMLLVNPEELEFSTDDTEKSLTLTAINLNNIRIELDNVTDFQMNHGTAASSAIYKLSSTDYPNALGKNKVGDIVINTKWITNSIVNDGMITIYNVDDDNAVLAKVKLVGAGKYLHKEGAKTTGLYTGVPNGTRDTDGDGNPNTEYKYTFHGSDYNTEYPYHHVDLSNAFAADGTALFDYLIVYGETTTTDATKNITAPSGENGSNARTPYYVYARDVDAYGNYDRYRHVTMVDNANVGTKAHILGVTMQEDGKAVFMGVDAGQKMSVYMTGFCPYATTGYTSDQEGAWFFRGKHGAKLDVYLDNCYMFSRNKMETGRPFYTRGDERNPTFTENYARGSGGVLVFECVDESNDVALAQAFDVTIHTIGKNLLKSNYGSFCYFFGMDPFQISAPIHVRMHSSSHVRKSKTSLTFDDKWPTAMNSTTGEIITTQRTNGFLSLQKMNNNAPSIDLGNPNTVVNFRGGQVELQNAQIVSTNYKTTLAISYRSGEYGGDNVGLKFAAGIGTDSVGGEVNFYDGTVTVLPMWVQEEYKQYYLIDKDANGNEITRTVGGKTEYLTTCLRCPKNTEVYGGSVCWLRACQHVTSKGGAPTFAGKYLGQYIYDISKSGGEVDPTGLATQISFPEGIVNEKNEPLSGFYNTYHPDKKYGVESVSPADGKLYFWIPEGFGGVSAEKDKLISTWKACMTRIEAGYQGKSGGVGGDTPVEPNEEIKYMLYCKIDENMHEVISAGEGDDESRVYTYEAPVKVPSIGQGFVGGEYTTIKPTYIGDDFEHQILSDIPYAVTDKVYYVTTATADVWQSFTAPFNVAKIWVVETYDEKILKKTPLKDDLTSEKDPETGEYEKFTKRKSVMLEQAKHNADFAAFFGVAMAIGSTDPFETIFDDWKKWGMLKDKETMINGTPLYSGELSGYKLRGRAELIPYLGNNWETAHFYLNENKGNWELDAEADTFKVKWEMLTETDLEDGILLHQGETYSMLFPYCTGCWEEDDRSFWDYWSGKILIFESTDGKVKGEHSIQGSNFVAESKVEEQPWIFDNVTLSTENAVVTGNRTFAQMQTNGAVVDNIWTYYPTPGSENFYPLASNRSATISPTTSFLYANVPDNGQGMPAKRVTRDGRIIYGESGDNNDPNNGTTTGSHTPTIGGGNSLFVTGIAGGINIAVAQPQFVQVISATGVVLYNGYVTDNVNVPLPINGIYVIKGENEAQKIFF